MSIKVAGMITGGIVVATGIAVVGVKKWKDNQREKAKDKKQLKAMKKMQKRLLQIKAKQERLDEEHKKLAQQFLDVIKKTVTVDMCNDGIDPRDIEIEIDED